MNLSNTNTQNTTVQWFNRIALFVVFFWFGTLKVVGVSPAEQIVSKLHALTLARFISINTFLPFLGYLECFIGIIWLGLTILFEFGFGYYVMGNTWEKLLHDYNLAEGRVWSLFLVWITIAPYVFYKFFLRLKTKHYLHTTILQPKMKQLPKE